MKQGRYWKLSRTLPKRLKTLTSCSEDISSKKSRIDAIWAEMNDNNSNNHNNDTKSPKITATEQTTPSPIASSAQPPPTVLPPSKKLMTKRPKSALSSLVSKYNIKEPKMNTLEKSKLDWQGYVDREGIRDDLKYKNKDGYMEKVAFLQRVDDRRLNQLKQGQQKGKKNE